MCKKIKQQPIKMIDYEQELRIITQKFNELSIESLRHLAENLIEKLTELSYDFPDPETRDAAVIFSAGRFMNDLRLLQQESTSRRLVQ